MQMEQMIKAIHSPEWQNTLEAAIKKILLTTTCTKV